MGDPEGTGETHSTTTINPLEATAPSRAPARVGCGVPSGCGESLGHGGGWAPGFSCGDPVSGGPAPCWLCEHAVGGRPSTGHHPLPRPSAEARGSAFGGRRFTGLPSVTAVTSRHCPEPGCVCRKALSVPTAGSPACGRPTQAPQSSLPRPGVLGEPRGKCCPQSGHAKLRFLRLCTPCPHCWQGRGDIRAASPAVGVAVPGPTP